MKKKTLYIINFLILNSFFFLLLPLYSQDVHFSQFYQTPVLINPALTGAFNGNIRTIINYKDQWRSVASPYKTSAFSFDATLFKKKWPNSYIGAGLFLYKDKAGDANLSTTQVNISLASIIFLNEYNKLSLGLQGGLGQRSATTNNLKWDNQYDGFAYDPKIGGESIPPVTAISPDFSAGLAWSYGKAASTLSSGNRISFNAGGAFHHFNKPSLQIYGAERIYSKIVVHAGGYIGLNNTWLAFLPSAIYFRQGPFSEINIGTLVRYTIKEESVYTGIFKESAILVGGHYRVGDAFIPSFTVEFGSFAIGLSYDVNISQLKTASSARGGMELSLKYVNPNPFRSAKASHKSVRFL